MLMIDKALKGSRSYWTWLLCLLLVMAAGSWFYLRQLDQGLVITGLSRDVSWGLYIAQFTFFVGVAASAVMVVLPYYLHNEKQFAASRFLASFSPSRRSIMCILFIFVDLGQPARILNIILYPSPRSLMFWDMISSQRLPAAQLDHRIGHIARGARRSDNPGMDQADCDHLDSLGDQHSHRDRISL